MRADIQQVVQAKESERRRLRALPCLEKLEMLDKLRDRQLLLQQMRSSEEAQRNPLVISAIRQKSVLQFSYNGKLRTVEPQTYGLSTTGREVLRAFERTAASSSKRSGAAKLFDLEKISGLRETGQTFQKALSTHNPDDSAMVEVFATLPAPEAKLAPR